MYSKMAFNNVKKSFKDYTVYFLTLTFAVCIFYSFNSINSQSILSELNEGQAQYIDMLNQMMSILSVGVSVILGALIIYATNFLIKRRKKEFGLYMILGMKKRSMSTILFLETFYIGVISLLAGLILGLILAQILSIFTAKLFVLEMTKYSFSISYQAIVKTAIYFAIMYLIVMVFNVICVSRYKLIELLSAGRKNEKMKVKNIYISSFIFITSIIILGFSYHYIGISSLDYTKIEFKYSIILGIVGTLLFFYGISSVLFYMVSKKSSIYYNKLNSFSIRQISSKFNTNFISMTVICLMLLVTIGSLACGLAVKDSMESTLKKSTQFDASISYYSIDEDAVDKNPIEAMESLGYDINDKCDSMIVRTYYSENANAKDLLSKYAVDEDKTIQEMINGRMFEKSINMIPVSVFNQVRKMQGNEPIGLSDNEILVASNYDAVKGIMNKFVDNVDGVNIYGKEYKLKERKVFDDCLYTTPTASVLFALVVPDKIIENNDVHLYEQVININFKGNDEEKKLEEEKLTKILNKESFMDNNEHKKLDGERGFWIDGMTRQMCMDASRGLSTLVLFVTIYLGIVFLLSSAAVLALQQLSSCNESIDRYSSLRKIGASKSMINRSIFTQVAIFFMFPLGLAIIHSIVGIRAVNSYLMALGSSNKLSSIFVTALIIIIVYGGYLYGTYISYKNVIDNEFN